MSPLIALIQDQGQSFVERGLSAALTGEAETDQIILSKIVAGNVSVV